MPRIHKNPIKSNPGSPVWEEEDRHADHHTHRLAFEQRTQVGCRLVCLHSTLNEWRISPSGLQLQPPQIHEYLMSGWERKESGSS